MGNKETIDQDSVLDFKGYKMCVCEVLEDLKRREDHSKLPIGVQVLLQVLQNAEKILQSFSSRCSNSF